MHMTPAQLAEFVDQRLKEAREKERREEKQEEERKRKEKEKEVKRKEQKRKEKERLAKEKKLAALQAAPMPFAPLMDVGDAPGGGGAVGGASTSTLRDARIVIPGGSHSVLHGEQGSFLLPRSLIDDVLSPTTGFSGSTNKMRYMVDTGDSLLGISLCGDLVEWNPSTAGGTAGAGVRKVHRSTTDLYRVDDFAYSESKGIVVVPYLGVKQDKALSAPKNQVVLFKRDRDPKVSDFIFFFWVGGAG